MSTMVNIAYIVLNSIKKTVKNLYDSQCDSINVLGKQKPRKWMQQSQGIGIFCDIINVELDTVKGLEKLPGLAAITPEFINSWSVSGCKELARTLTQILLSAADWTRFTVAQRLG